uniref:Protein yellow n=1 Tax=Xenopsylla cheopis TaxID=163159 RepID=A0A6M2DZL1_XENCH
MMSITKAHYILAFLFVLKLGQSTRVLRERFSWRSLDFAYPGNEERQRALRSGQFIPENALPVGIETWGDKMFVTVPRWREGIPATLTTISLHSNEKSPALEPYPDWSTNKQGDCLRGLTTAYRIKVDECDRLWVLDTGTVGIGNTTVNVCPYALNIFDLRTNRRIRRTPFRPEDTNQNTFIANIAIDMGTSCEDTFAYMSDELGYGLIVYSWAKDKTWRFEHSFFMPDPLKGDFNVAGLNFQWGEEGIFGLALSPIMSDGYKTLFFGPLASEREFAVSTKILRDEKRVEDSYHDFQVLEERETLGHVTAKVMDDNGLMLYNLIDRNAIGCWHSSSPYQKHNHALVDKDDVGLVFPSDVKIDKGGIAWVMSDRMPVFLLSELDYQDINFRIYWAPVHELVKGTVCEVDSTRNSIFYEPIFYKQPIIYKPVPNQASTPAAFWWHSLYY